METFPNSTVLDVFLNATLANQTAAENETYTYSTTPASAVPGNGTAGGGTHTDAAGDGLSWDDATWILTSSFIIFTMQSGFGLLECGNVSSKNEVNIMVKNAVDVLFGGLTYWMFGFGITFGMAPGTNAFCGVGDWFLDSDDEHMGVVFAKFIFQLSFATTSTTIVSGAMAERTKLNSYIVFSMLNTVVYIFPAHWVWAPNGFLYTMGVIDVAGTGAVHLCGASCGLVATLLLKPRVGRFDDEKGGGSPEMSSPTNVLLGTFMLWWGWLGFNCGSTYGIQGGKWKLAARSAVSTMLGSLGGGLVGVTYSYATKKGQFNVGDIVNGILGGLVSVTAICAIASPFGGLVIGSFGGLVADLGVPLLNYLKIDDPVGAVPVHGFAAIWGMLAVGLFALNDSLENFSFGRKGLLYGGGPYLLGVQLIAVVVIILWGAGISFVLLKLIDLTMGLRMSEEEEELGADICEHEIDQETDPYEEIQRYLTICGAKENKMAVPKNKMAADAEDDGKGTGREMAAAGETRGMFAIARALFQADKTDRPYTPNGIADGGTHSNDPINFDRNWILRRAMKEH
ncbi:PREDICTED: putative ammonium transporter 3 [Branchiostoma belcheri]|uniref:Ammonium transporter n=1 Tax=Branchiostoma belcheri TaxID=7741 RepID=A0A6P5AAI5_BRABE|nr:PREDICTED: putative ammonium transporter 3 [Branchiostoma belcheri]